MANQLLNPQILFIESLQMLTTATDNTSNSIHNF